ncbi:chromosome segregation protein Csm1/Pcs1-domain-containing protein [Massariosphaeria phaeospora]|uniref:Chromosome segregation protein Csm1/Pcs1-domain-containing protein n=1 Tax=Massariosphaeria phaeospora TaxID=100035 RepID=A0A7C8ILJ8_9PLEO|nr:chromosome segregation protein Csm1/Pcs1-domain-containing protein [Massariosphaeria phaeospora]
MAPRNALANISFTVDSGSEDEMARDNLNAFPTPDSNTENRAPTRKPRGKAAPMAKPASTAKASTKAKRTTRRSSGDDPLSVKPQSAGVAKKKPGAKGGRKVLAERDTVHSDTEEVDEFDGDDAVAAPLQETKPTRRGRPPKAEKAQEEEAVAAKPGRKTTRKTAEKEPTAKPAAKAKAKPTGKSRGTKRAPELEPEPEPEVLVVPETQPDFDDPMDIEESIEVEDEIPESMPPPPPPRPSGRRNPPAARPSRQQSAGPRRAGSASDTERDPVLRRKLGELTKKLEAMTTKYDALKEAASSGKESNFDQLKRKTEQAAKEQDAVIKTLKSQLSETQSRTAELTSLRRDMTSLTSDNTRLAAEKKTLADSLAAAHNENKTLSSKLAAARWSAPPEAKPVPGSAIKARSTGVVLPGAAEAAKDAQFQKQKVDLYSDLTNLVVIGSRKSEDDEQVYDCLQTGRNGTLHFHLTVATPSAAASYDDTEFVYNPLLNEQRDRELLDLLPDYLTEEICFPRAQAAKFYMKVVDSMSKKFVLDE